MLKSRKFDSKDILLAKCIKDNSIRFNSILLSSRGKWPAKCDLSVVLCNMRSFLKQNVKVKIEKWCQGKASHIAVIIITDKFPKRKNIFKFENTI